MKITIFYSWQSDSDSRFNKDLIKTAINRAIKEIEDKGQLKGVFFEFQESSSNIPGSPNIPNTIDERINECDIFIGDLTICNQFNVLNLIFKFFGVKYKLSPNVNVYAEYFRALGEKAKQVISIINTAYGNPNDNNSLIPFDSRHIRFPFSYECKKEKQIEVAENKLTNFFSESIKKSVLALIDENRYKYSPFITYAEHKKLFDSKAKYYLNKDLEKYKNIVLNDNWENLRIVGLSGMGKTRFVLESVGSKTELINRYLYCDCNAYDWDAIRTKTEEILKEKSKPLLVLDNCDNLQAQSLLNLEKKYNINSGVIITICNVKDDVLIEKYSYLDLDDLDLHDVVREIIQQKGRNIDEVNQKLIDEFSDGIPLMALLLTEGIDKTGGQIGKLTSKDFVNKVIIGGDEEERSILKSCALFRFVGFKDDVRDQIKFLLENDIITPIEGSPDNRLIKFDKIYLKYKKKEVIENKGRLFSLRPRPLGLALAAEWFAECHDDRLAKVLALLSDTSNPLSSTLTESLCSQIKYLGEDIRVVALIDSLLKIHGPFDNAKVVNTKLGSRLFRSFVEVNPIAVAQCLDRLFGDLSIDDLLFVKEGRRNIIWALEKLCFDRNTFDIGAKLMMSFAVAENEKISNNAKGQFLHLFKVYLPGTEVDFNERVKIIVWGLARGSEFEDLALAAIYSALNTQNLGFFSGAEKQGRKTLEHYHPHSYSDIYSYWQNLIEILEEKILTSKEKCIEICDAINDKLRGVIRWKGFYLLKKLIGLGIKIRENDWDSLFDNLNTILIYDKEFLIDKEVEDINEWINLLRKNDFISRFQRASKDIVLTSRKEKISFDERSENIRIALYALANEFTTLNEEKRSEILINLFKIQNLQIPIPSFGRRLSEIYKSDFELNKEFIELCLNSFEMLSPNYNRTIFIDYAVGVNDEIYKYLLDRFQRSKQIANLIFVIMAARRVDIEKLDLLFHLIESKLATVNDFCNFFYTYLITPNLDQSLAKFFPRLEQYGQDATNTIIYLLNTIFYFKNDRDIYPILSKYAEQFIVKLALTEDHNTKNRDLFSLIIELLEKNNSPELAMFANDELIKIANINFSFSHNNDFQRIYEILLSKYFEFIWPNLSRALLSKEDKYLVYHNFKDLLGATIGSPTHTGFILFDGTHDHELEEWCLSNPEDAPQRLAAMVPMYSSNGFHSLVNFLLDKFGEDNGMLNELSANMGSHFWVGSLVPLIQQKIDALQILNNHANLNVVTWAKQEIEYAKERIRREQQKDEENDFLYS